MNRAMTILLVKLFLLLAVILLPGAALADLGDYCSDGIISVPCFFNDGPAGSQSFGALILTVIQILLLVVGSLSVLFLIIGGVRYVTAAGNEENAEGAKKTMTHAVIGLIVVVLSFAIITIITNVLLGGARGI